MKIIDKIDNYLDDLDYQIIIKNNQINIINYTEIINFLPNQVTVRYLDKLFVIEGENLSISRMVLDEVLIIGNIKNVRIN